MARLRDNPAFSAPLHALTHRHRQFVMLDKATGAAHDALLATG
jgi:hypothetical protein